MPGEDADAIDVLLGRMENILYLDGLHQGHRSADKKKISHSTVLVSKLDR